MPSPDTATATITPATHVAALTLSQLGDFLRCPFRYRMRHVLAQNGAIDPSRKASRLARQALVQVLREQQQTGQALAAKDIAAIVHEEAATSDDGAIAHAARLVTAWHDRLGRELVPVAVDTKFRIDLEAGDRWTIEGRIPLAFTTAATTYPQIAIIQFVPALWSDDRIHSDIVLPLMMIGARESLELHELTSVRLHQVTYSGEVREAAPLIDDRRCRESLVLAAAARAGIRAYMTDLDGSQPWPPARGSQDCSSAACPFVEPCIEMFGGSVPSTAHSSGAGAGTNDGPGSR